METCFSFVQTVLVLEQICSARPCIWLCTNINKSKNRKKYTLRNAGEDHNKEKIYITCFYCYFLLAHCKRITVVQIWTITQPWVTPNFSHNPYTAWTQHNQTLCKIPSSLWPMSKVLHNQNKYLDLEAAWFQWTWLKFFVGRTLFQSGTGRGLSR